MCGIVGYIGKRQAQDLLIEGLHRLEYRGYDSAGVALLAKGKVKRIRALGKVVELEKKTDGNGVSATLGIAHTRWATHGKPAEKNAHPHADCSGAIALVHNGIIENYGELRERLLKQGHRFTSETDTEVVAHLIEECRKKSKDFEAAFATALKALRGTYGIAAVSAEEPDRLFVARMGSPLLIGVGKDEYFVASDVSAILAHTKRVVYLEDGERAVIGRDNYVVKTGVHITHKDETDIAWSEKEAERGGYPHFMLKEILDQPESFADALRGRLLPDEGTARLGGLREVAKRLENIKRIVIVSCGTSYHAGLIGEYMLEEYAGIPVEVEYASEFRYRKPILDKYTAVLALSQSGETADTLATPGAPESNGGCGWSNSVRLSGLGYARISVDKLTCEMTAAMALWVAHDVQPAAEALFGERVRAIRHLGSYACRTIRGNPAHAHVVSEHARANALDIQAFVLTSGRQVSVLQHWGHAGKDGEFLAAVHSKACRYFRVAIGPAYNAAHRDHFHYDRGFYSACK